MLLIHPFWACNMFDISACLFLILPPATSKQSKASKAKQAKQSKQSKQSKRASIAFNCLKLCYFIGSSFYSFLLSLFQLSFLYSSFQTSIKDSFKTYNMLHTHYILYKISYILYCTYELVRMHVCFSTHHCGCLSLSALPSGMREHKLTSESLRVL